jgi:hypothetical protein
VVVVVYVHRICRWRTDLEIVGGGGVKVQMGSLYRWGDATKVRVEALVVGLGSALTVTLLYTVVVEERR